MPERARKDDLIEVLSEDGARTEDCSRVGLQKNCFSDNKSTQEVI